MRNIGKFCVITDTKIQNKYTHYEIANLALRGGADMIQLRDKTMGTDEFIETAVKIKRLCAKKGAVLIINDRTDIALAADAGGVHLGKEDLPIKEARKLLGRRKIIGATAHSIAEAKIAEKEGADYIGFGHIFPTSTKAKKEKPRGITGLKKAVKIIKLPILAIGGISINNLESVLQTSVNGVAVCSAIVKSKDPMKEAELFYKKIFNFHNL